MSYTDLDAWLDEKALGDWPFDRWDIGTFPLRENYDYFGFYYGVSGVGALQHRLLQGFGSRSRSRLAECLAGATETVRCAIEQSDADAYVTWLRHEVWLPVLDDSLDGSAEPADMLAQSVEYVGVPDDFTGQEVLCALGLWLIGALSALKNQRSESAVEILVQIGVATSEAEYFRGLAQGKKIETDKLVSRTKKAIDARHAANRVRIQAAETWWKNNGHTRMTQAQSARVIAEMFHVVEDVAKRWVRQFERKTHKT